MSDSGSYESAIVKGIIHQVNKFQKEVNGWETVKDWKNSELAKVYEEMKIKMDRLDELENQIGELPEGLHPDERKPRAETWLKERENWEAEIDTARKYIQQLEKNHNAALKLAASNFKEVKEVRGEGITDGLQAKVDFYREQTDKLREYIHDNKLGLPNQGFFDILYDHVQQVKAENEKLKSRGEGITDESQQKIWNEAAYIYSNQNAIWRTIEAELKSKFIIVRKGDNFNNDALGFAEFCEKNYTILYSIELDFSAWVNHNENEILHHGSDSHYTKLLEEAGFTTQQLYEIYKKSYSHGK